MIRQTLRIAPIRLVPIALAAALAAPASAATPAAPAHPAAISSIAAAGTLVASVASLPDSAPHAKPLSEAAQPKRTFSLPKPDLRFSNQSLWQAERTADSIKSR